MMELAGPVLEAALSGLMTDGIVVSPPLFGAAQLQLLRDAIDLCYDRQVREAGGESVLQQIGDLDTVRLPLASHPVFLEVALSAPLAAIPRLLFGDACILLEQTAVLNRPGQPNPAKDWHRDLTLPRGAPREPAAVSLVLCVDDFTDVTGGTCFLAGSQNADGSASELERTATLVAPAAAAGSLLIFNARIYHRCRDNLSGAVRRGITHIVGPYTLAQQISIPRCLGPRPDLVPRVRRFLGYSAEPASSALEWRRRRLDRTVR